MVMYLPNLVSNKRLLDAVAHNNSQVMMWFLGLLEELFRTARYSIVLFDKLFRALSVTMRFSSQPRSFILC